MNLLNCLLVEDSPDDAFLLLEELASAGYDAKWKRVEKEPEYRASLSEHLDLIFCDFTLPEFTPAKALSILHETGLDIPLIVVTGTIGEERVVEVLKSGATDCLLKHRLERIGQAVERALRETRLRKERRALEQKLRLQATALETAANAIAITDRGGTYIWVNPAFCQLTGYPVERALGQRPSILNSGHHPREYFQDLWETIVAGKTWRGEITNRRPDGSLYHVEQTITPVHGANGTVEQFVGIMNDVTSRRQAEDELRVTHDKLRYLLSHNPAVFYALRIEENQLTPYLVSETVKEMFGFTLEECCRPDWWAAHVHPEDQKQGLEHTQATLIRGDHRLEYRIRHKNGTYRWIEDNQRVVRDPVGRPSEIAGVWIDITARKNLEQEIVRRQERLNSFFSGATAGLAILDRELRYVQVNETLAQMNGLPVEEHLGRKVAEVLPGFSKVILPHFSQVLASGNPVLNVELFGDLPSGPARYFLCSFFPVQNMSGQVEALGAIVVEQTERRRAEAAQRSSEEKFRQLAETINDVFWISTADLTEVIYVSPAFERIWGLSSEKLYEDPKCWREAIVPEDRMRVIEGLQALNRGAPLATLEYRIRRADGTICWISDRGFPIKNEKGEIYRLAGVAADVTEKKSIEAQLLRSQRLESIGTLAGGIAHDLNNALAPILMAVEILQQETANPETKELLQLVSISALRGSEMVKQLLTFSRGVQGTHTILQLKHLIREMQTIVRQTFPKNIQALAEFAPDVWAVQGDATQLHQVLLNLCVNARDAMPTGGTLTLKLSNVEIDEHFASMRVEAKPGPYVLLSVKDTGCGMTPDVKERIFEPFFTTKPIDKGTGLGLSTVRGIVQGHEGFISVYSEAGKGTEFHVYIPAKPSDADIIVPQIGAGLPRGRGELILVVDDEEAVRHLTQKTLEAFGYAVVTASNGATAVAMCAQHLRNLSLVITDLAMPIMDGHATIRAIRTLAPKLSIIATSGLYDEGRAAQITSAGADAFIHKPCTADRLLRKIKEVLDANVR